ncbi:MAG TPA: single-stranded-DNA-specific exonuclease RecJ [Longimicrobiales bacterium]|nr:single-stranded-DNA-specific exonuclease RecJ [Longimicrobiales bacterium]
MPSGSSVLALPPRRWVQRAAAGDDAAVAELAAGLGLPEPLCRLLVQRGHAEPGIAKRFLRPKLESLHDPFLLTGMHAAVERVGRAIDRGEPILVHGDYDVDGVCAAALYTRVLRRLGARAEAFVPHRLTDGYDLSRAGIRRAAELGATLILTGDCGIVAHEAVAQAAAAGIDVVVTDHHTPGPELPAAVAVVNPSRADCAYPEATLCGAGVAFKLCQALAARHGLAAEELWYELDLVALATIADLVPLTGENRVLARYGLKVLRETRNPGLRTLLRTAGLDGREELAAGHVSHVLGPRINAAGRIGEAFDGVRLLLARDEAEAEPLAQRMEAANRERQAVDQRTLDEALGLLEAEYDPERDYAVVLAGEGWHPGVIGIVASRVVERIHRPTVLIAVGAGHARGSARSIRGFHLYDALSGCAEHLERFGGHRYAAGLDIEPARIPAFRQALNERARAALTPADLVPEVEVDLELRLRDATHELHRYLRHFGPFGTGNPAPVFAARGVVLAGRPRIAGRDHVKLRLLQDGAQLEAIGFRMADRLPALEAARALDVAFQLQENRWNGRVELQARLVDVRPAE